MALTHNLHLRETIVLRRRIMPFNYYKGRECGGDIYKGNSTKVN